MYRILFTKSADKALRAMPHELAQHLRERLDLIAQDPYAQHSNTTKLQNRPGYRVRVGDWRAIYEIEGENLIILVLRRATGRGVPMNVQVIEKGGKPEWAVIPYEEFQRLLEDAEMLQDVRAYDDAKHALAAGAELVPSEVTYAILDGGNPVRVWREHRGLTQQQVAEAAGISVPYLSQIESGKRRGSAEVLAAIAKVLQLSLDDILD